MTYVPERGDIVWADFSPQVGHEQAKRRPALVLTPRQYNAVTRLLLACPISRQIKGYKFEVPLPGGLQTTGVVIADQIRNFDWSARHVDYRETSTPELVEEVIARVAALLKPPSSAGR